MANKIYTQFTEVVTPADGDWVLIYDISADEPRLRRISVANLLVGPGVGDDETDPEMLTLSPADDATGVAAGANLVITFDEDVQAGTGNITIVATAGPTNFEVIPVGDPKVVIAGAVVTINPAGTLAASTAYHVLIAATAFEDLAGNPYAGIASATAWNFATAAAAQDRYWGFSSSTSLNEAGITGLTDTDTDTDNDNTFTAAPTGDQYLYYSFPVSLGLLTSVIVTGNPTNQIAAYTGDNGTFTSPATVNVDAVPYYVYRSNQLLSITVERTFT